jgi:hypothetical protein
MMGDRRAGAADEAASGAGRAAAVPMAMPVAVALPTVVVTVPGGRGGAARGRDWGSGQTRGRGRRSRRNVMRDDDRRLARGQCNAGQEVLGHALGHAQRRRRTGGGQRGHPDAGVCRDHRCK